MYKLPTTLSPVVKSPFALAHGRAFRAILGTFTYALAMFLTCASAIVCASSLLASTAHAKPLKVFILSGQSNMQGHAAHSTFDYIGKDPATREMLAKMQVDAVKDVYISYLSEKRGGVDSIKAGPLTSAYGASEKKIGPEYTFGIYMAELINEPFLIIKTAWGGKSLNKDFLPPSAGGGGDGSEGTYYRKMVDHIDAVLQDVKAVHPAYDAKNGYEIAGFVWFQGWNDIVDRDVYPNRKQPGGYDLYSELLTKFITDVRKDLKVPEMPFVIGVAGHGGARKEGHLHDLFRKAMAAPAAKMNNVIAVETYKSWDPLQQTAMVKKHSAERKLKAHHKEIGKTLGHRDRVNFVANILKTEASQEEIDALEGVSNKEYHYLGSAKIMANIGKQFAEALAK